MSARLMIAWIWLLSAVVSFITIIVDLSKHPQRMKIMNWVWPLCCLWGGPFVYWMYARYGRNRPGTGGVQMSMSSMDDNSPAMMSTMADHKETRSHASTTPQDKEKALIDKSLFEVPDTLSPKVMPPSDGGMDKVVGKGTMLSPTGVMVAEAGNNRPFWVKVMLSAFHCGAGCTLADIIGEWAGFLFLSHLSWWSIFAQWGLDYVLALCIGVIFQYVVIHKMLHLSVGKSIWRALKIDFLSLTSWQIGMYAFMAFVVFVYPQEYLQANNLMFWFVMQVSMIVGLFLAYPTNYWLIKAGVKPGM